MYGKKGPRLMEVALYELIVDSWLGMSEVGGVEWSGVEWMGG